MVTPVLLVIDDEPLIRECLRFTFSPNEVDLTTAETASAGLRQFTENRPNAVVLDVHLPDMSGFDVFRRMHEIDAKVPVILVTGHGTAQNAIEAMRLGVYDYLVKPFDPDQLKDLVGRAFETERMMRVPALLQEQHEAADSADLLVGRCPAMQEVYKSIGRAAPQDVTVLILGESGTGKELVARALYHYGNRSGSPFLAINCAAIPEQLLESELFGHEKGAFTGADRRRIGKFEQCTGGTLFLDEIGDMSPLTQSKILRVLQDQQFERVGGNETVVTNVRLIAATNRDLKKMMAKGQFRRDLYYRLHDFAIHLPPLRERIEDLPLLVQHILQRAGRELGRDVQAVSSQAMEMLSVYSWPGNVRELQSVLRQAIVHASGPILNADAFPIEVTGAKSGITTASQDADWPPLTTFIEDRLRAGSMNLHPEVLAVVERQLFKAVMRHTHNNLSQAARILGITRPTLRSRLAFLGLASADSRAPAEELVD